MTRRLLAAFIACLVSSAAVPPCHSDDSDENPVRTARVETELQRRLLGNDLDWFVLMNPAAVIVDEQISMDAHGWQVLANTLEGLPTPDDRRQQPGIRILFAFSEKNHELMRQNDRYKRRAAEVIRAAGCRDVSISDIFTTNRLNWQDHVAAFDDPAVTDESRAEPETRSGTVSVYPVRTRLTRYITNASDCFVDFRRPLDESGGVVAPASLDEAISLVTDLEIQQRRVITFQVTGEFEIGAGKTALGVIGIPDELPADLGFERSQAWRR